MNEQFLEAFYREAQKHTGMTKEQLEDNVVVISK